MTVPPMEYLAARRQVHPALPREAHGLAGVVHAEIRLVERQDAGRHAGPLRAQAAIEVAEALARAVVAAGLEAVRRRAGVVPFGQPWLVESFRRRLKYFIRDSPYRYTISGV